MIIRHEINILNGTWTANTTPPSERIFFDYTKYSGILTIYLEVVATSSVTLSVRLCDAAGSNIGFPQVTVTSGTNQLYRSAAITTTNTIQGITTTPWVTINCNTTTASLTVKSARLIVLQDTGTDNLTASETQLEIGNRQLATTVSSTTVAQALVAPKYWKYDSSLWDGTLSVYGELTYLVSSTTGNKTFTIQQDDGAFANWTDVCTILSASTGSITAARVRSTSSFTPINGRNYRLAIKNDSTMSTISVYNAKIIVQQALTTKDSFNQTSFNSSNQIYGDNNSLSGNEALGHSITPTSSYTIGAIGISLGKTGSPTDNLICKIWDAHPSTGSVVSTSNTISASSLSSGSAVTGSYNGFFTFTSGNYITTNATKFFITIERSGVADTNNYCSIGTSVTDTYSNYSIIKKITGTWGAETTSEFDIKVYSNNYITKLEEQYLLANTTLAAGTALQNFLTKYDPAEWSGVDTSFIHQVDASASNTSVVELDTAAGVPLANSSVFSVGSNSIGAAFDSNIVTNSGGGGITAVENGFGQSFTANSSGKLTFGVAQMVRDSTFTGTLVARIYAHSGTYGSSSIATGSPLSTSNGISIATLNTATYNMVYFPFTDGFSLVSGTQYVFMVVVTVATGTGGVYPAQGSTATHGGNAITKTGSTFTSNSLVDMIFSVNGASLTIPSVSTNLDVKATTNSGSIFGSRMLARITKTAVIVTQAVTKALAMLGVG